LAGLTLAGAAQAQTIRVEPSVAASVVATNNVDLSASAAARSDLVLSVSPQVLLRGTGGNYQFDGSVGVTGVHYTRGTLTDRLLPRAHVGASARLIDRLLFVEGQLDADTTGVDPFRVVGDGATTYNRQNVTRMRLSPFIDRQLSPLTRLTLRSDNTWAHVGNAQNSTTATTTTTPGNDTYVQSDLLRLDRRPTPLGYQLEATRVDTSLRQQGTDSGVLTDTERAILLYAPDPQLHLGLRLGHDRVEYATTRISDTFRGVGLQWAPSLHTNLDMMVEQRFFGSGWTANLLHRSGFLSMSVNLSRQLTSYAQSLATLPSAGSTSTMLDQIYKLSIPDDARRAQVIRELMARYNLPDNTSGPLDIYSDRPQILQSGGLNFTLTGVRHTLSLNLFQQKTIDLGGQETTVPLPSRDVLQRGWTLSLNRRMTPYMTANGAVSYAHSEDLGLIGRQTTSRSVRLGLSRKLSPRSDASAGLRLTQVSSTIAADAQETAVYVGMTHRF
jgi:uncharacterized protein (PEP-CTERM system associated)